MCIVVVVLCVLLSYVYLLYCVGISSFFTLDAGLLARSQYSEGPSTGHLETGFSLFSMTRTNADIVPKIPIFHYIFLPN